MEVFWRNKDELLKLKDELDENIDHFVEYIDDGKQYERALRWNEILINRMEFIDDLIKEFNELAQKTKIDVNEFQYRKGFIRVMYNGKYKYKRCLAIVPR